MLALIDGDVLCYNACESRFKKDEKGNWIVDKNNMGGCVVYTPEEEVRYLDKAWNKFNDLVKQVCETVYADHFLMAVKGPDNFRNLLYPDYKLHRHKNQPNLIVPKLRELAVDTGVAIASIGREADDLLRIWALQAAAVDEEYVVCSIDKDLKCIHGNHFTFNKGAITGAITNVSKISALRFYYEQLLKGDQTDNIPGIPGIGPVKAKSILAAYSDEESFQEAVVEAYMSFYESDWYDYLLSNGKMIHLQTNETDFFSCSHWPIVRAMLEAQKQSSNIETEIKDINIDRENKEKNDRPEEVISPSICDPSKIKIFTKKTS